MTTAIFTMLETPKGKRVVEANRVIDAVSRHGRRFFWCEQKQSISRFEIDRRSRIWLVDKWTGRRIYVAYEGRWKGFSDGGTLKSLIEALRDYISTGEPINPRYFGPWPQHYCDGDLWGYGLEAMEALRVELDGMPAVGPRAKAAA